MMVGAFLNSIRAFYSQLSLLRESLVLENYTLAYLILVSMQA